MKTYFIHQLLFCLLIFIPTNTLFGQKKSLDHSVYDNWKSITKTQVSDNGEIISMMISPQEGDTTLWILNAVKNTQLQIERVNKFNAYSDGSYIIAMQKAPYASVRQARIDKKKKEDFPKDTLIIINGRTLAIDKIPNVKSFKTGKEKGSHIAFTIAAAKDTTKKEKTKQKDLVVLYNLSSKHQDTIQNAKEYVFNKYGNSFATIIQPDKEDTVAKPQVLFYDLNKDHIKTISSQPREYKSIDFDETGTQLIYISTADTLKTKQKEYDVRYFAIDKDSAIIIADSRTKNLPDNWVFNEHAAPRFSKNGKRIIIGTAPRQQPTDTTIVDFEMASLDIWNWKDPVISPQQLSELKREQNKTYTSIISTSAPYGFVRLANEDMPYATIADEDNGRFALLWSDKAYQLESQWDISPRTDVGVFDIENNSFQNVGKTIKGRPIISPAGNYIAWWDGTQKQWFSYNISAQTISSLTANIPVNFWDEKNDTPSVPGSYGIAGWGERDESVYINDAFDIWKIDPKGINKPTNITSHIGRRDSITFQYINTDSEKRFIGNSETLLLSAFDNKSKEKGYYTLDQKRKNRLERKVMAGYNFTGLSKAKKADVIVFQKSNFNTSPDLYVTNNYWQSEKKLTDINPQMEEYKWGTAELFNWISFADIKLQGIVYKPEDFDPDKKYPVMIYFYEQHSDNLYNYFSPAPSRSTINIPYFVSNDYIVFTPDINYTVGNPGNDAYNAIVSGAEALAKNPWVDKNNMAIQGQSWGGYQVAYLITRTDMFKAAGAGAPVSNMTSAYGGIRWESGRSRQFQYEQTQSRIGSTMMDSLQLYIDNSPVFFAKNVNTPLLIMHNDNDGAVPWYQGIEYFMTLRRLGKPVWLLQYNNEEHNLRERRNAKDLSIRLQQFFDHYLKGSPAPVWMTRGVPAVLKGKSWGYEIEE